MDAQCNEIYPEPEIESAEEPQWAEEMARHKAMTEEIQRKLGEQAARKAKKEAEEKAQQKLAEEENRKKEEEARQQKAAEEARTLAEEENRKKEEEKLAEEARKREEEAQQKLAEEVQKRAAAFARQQEEEAQQKLAEEENCKKEEEALAEEARKKAAEARRAAEEEEMMAMDVQCVDAFLKCTMTRMKTPIKGSNLYTKHIRPCRPVGTSVDVKDSSFRNLSTFLNFLEEEGLLRLQPGLSDPVVNQIRYEFEEFVHRKIDKIFEEVERFKQREDNEDKYRDDEIREISADLNRFKMGLTGILASWTTLCQTSLHGP